MKNVVLIGMMGSGKTACAKTLSAALACAHLDTDACIVAQEGRSVSAIFAELGEDYFRACELREAQHIAAEPAPCVIATGGGLPFVPEAIAALRRNGLTVYLQRDAGEIYDGENMTARPLAQDGRAAFVAMARRREAGYRACADIVVPVASTPEETAKAVLAALTGRL